MNTLIVSVDTVTIIKLFCGEVVGTVEKNICYRMY